MFLFAFDCTPPEEISLRLFYTTQMFINKFSLKDLLILQGKYVLSKHHVVNTEGKMGKLGVKWVA